MKLHEILNKLKISKNIIETKSGGNIGALEKWARETDEKGGFEAVEKELKGKVDNPAAVAATLLHGAGALKKKGG